MIALNQYCPRSGKPVAEDSLTQYRGFGVGFCNPHCRDDFAANATQRPEDSRYFDAIIQERIPASTSALRVVAPPTLGPSATLLLIDIQKAFDHPKWGQRNNGQAEENAARLLRGWRAWGGAIAHIRHLSSEEGSLFRADAPTFEFKEIVRPEAGEKVFTKEVNSAFIGTDLESWLRSERQQTLIVAGLTTPHCVSTTIRMAANLGFTPYLVADATAAFALTGPDGRYHPAETIHILLLRRCTMSSPPSSPLTPCSRLSHRMRGVTSGVRLRARSMRFNNYD